MVKNPLASSWDTVLSPVWKKIPHAEGQLSACATTTEPTPLEPVTTTTEAQPKCPGEHALQKEKPPLDFMAAQ